MKTVTAFVLALLCALAAQAQPTPSAYVPLAPCLLADSAFPAGDTYLLVRGKCNVPAEANSVTLNVVADSLRDFAGVAIQGSEIPWTGVVTLIVKRTESTQTTVRLCYPEPECRGEDVLVKVLGQPVHLQLAVVGYGVPLP